MRQLATLRRSLVRSGRLLDAQQARVQKLRAAGYDTGLAKSLLVNIEDTQLALFDSLARLDEEQAADAVGR